MIKMISEMRNLLLIALLFTSAAAVKAQPILSFNPVITGLSQPVDVVEVNDNSHRIFIVERLGTIRIWKGSALQSTPFLNASSFLNTDGQERGLLSLAFHPDYKNNGLFFIYYTNISGSVTVARYHRSNDSIADAASGVVLLTIPKRFSNHNGGKLLFGPDGYLYFGTGDGGSGGDPDNNAQNGQSLLGKMLRIDVSNPNPPYYSIPATNPFAGSTTTKEEIIATGLRNPWRWSFDKQTGDVWIADVGQDLWEEVNTVPAANRLNKDYGWSCLEATHSFKSCAAKANNVSPIFEYSHNNSTGGYSITGGFVYRGTEFPSLQGYYICADFVSANGWLIKSDENGGWSTTMQKNWPGSICSFGETADGTLYALTLSGTLYKVAVSSALPIHLVSFSGKKNGNNFEINWQVENEQLADTYILQKRTKSVNTFTEIYRTKATESHSVNGYSYKAAVGSEQLFYQLKIISRNGQIHYSTVISSDNKTSAAIKAFVAGTTLTLTLPKGTTNIELFNASGKVLNRQKINGDEGQIAIPLSSYSKGVITISAMVNNERQVVQTVY